VALGAALQAAAVLHNCLAEEVANAWQLDDGSSTEPDGLIDRQAIRDLYHQASRP
jgi:hypothetical protein